MHPGTRLVGATCLLASAVLASSLYHGAAARIQQLVASSYSRLAPQGRIIGLAVDPRHCATVYAGTDASGIYRSDNGGANWIAATAGVPSGTAVTGLLVDPSNDQLLYAATPRGIFKSANRGAGWLNAGTPTSAATTSFALDPSTPATVYAATAGDGVYRSTNGGTTWAAVGPSQARVQVVATVRDSGTTVYAGTDDGLFVEKAGEAWQRAGLGHVSVLSLGLTPADPAIIYVGTSDGVLVSMDRGVSWARTALRGTSISTLQVDPRQATLVYAASSQGGVVYRSDNGGRAWWSLVNGLERTPYQQCESRAVFPERAARSGWWRWDAGLQRPALATGRYAAEAAGVAEVITHHAHACVPGAGVPKAQ